MAKRPKPFKPANKIYNPEIDKKPRPNLLFVKHKRDGHNHGHYSAVSDHPLPQLRLNVDPVPDITISSGWLYVVGDAPCVGTTAVIAQAEGCQLLLQCFDVNNVPYHRVYYLSGQASHLVWLWESTDGTIKGGWSACLSVGTFVDAEADSTTGRFKTWRGKQQGQDPDIQTFSASDPVYAPIRDAVEAMRDDNGVG